jgi:hypothetical protein
MLVRAQPLQEKGDARSARMEIDHQNEAGNTGESETWTTGCTASW